jgi:ATP-dependent Clp protease protease subunit
MHHPLIKLLANNRKRGAFAVVAGMQADEATIFLYDMIVDSDIEAEWFGGIAPEAFIKQLTEIDAKTIHLRVNSPGGSVFAARAMEQALREHPANIVAHIDGFAASAASVLIMAADSIVMAPGAFLMIHKSWTMAYGNETDMLKTADLLQKVDASLVKTYAARSGQSPDEIAAMMAAETWLDDETSVSLGFADSVYSGDDNNTSAQAALSKPWDLSAYQHAPAAKQPTPIDKPNPQQKHGLHDRGALQRAVAVATLPA